MKKILFPTGFSSPANNAFTYAKKLANNLDASIDLIFVLKISIADSAAIPNELRSDFLNKKLDEAQIKMEGFVKLNPSDRINEQKIIYGNFIAAEIADEAEETKCDLIIMGMKGEHGKTDQWLGSVTTNLMMKAPCPVLAIPEKATYHGIKKVALATELPSSKEIPIQQVSKFAKALKAELEFVNVDNMVRRAKKYNEGTEKEIYFGKRFAIVTNPSIPDGLNDFVKTNHTDVLCLFIPKRRLWERLFHFSTSKEMAFHTDIPLLTYRV